MNAFCMRVRQTAQAFTDDPRINATDGVYVLYSWAEYSVDPLWPDTHIWVQYEKALLATEYSLRQLADDEAFYTAPDRAYWWNPQLLIVADWETAKHMPNVLQPNSSRRLRCFGL